MNDALVVVDHLLSRFGQENLVVLGYSYGSSIGPRLVEQHPDRFHAYVGLGQSGGPGSEAQLYSTLMERVREADVAGLLPAMAWAEQHLIDGAPEPRRGGMVERFEIPVVMLHGRFDLHTPYEGALDYFNRIDAPHKRFVTFQRSSHMIMFEEPGRMLTTLVNEVLPLAGGSQESGELDIS